MSNDVLQRNINFLELSFNCRLQIRYYRTIYPTRIFKKVFKSLFKAILVTVMLEVLISTIALVSNFAHMRIYKHAL